MLDISCDIKKESNETLNLLSIVVSETIFFQKQDVYFLAHQDQPSVSSLRQVTKRLLQAVFILFRSTGYISKVTVQT